MTDSAPVPVNSEVGSFFPAWDAGACNDPDPGFLEFLASVTLLNSGRAAARQIVAAEVGDRPDAVVWWPSYNCQDVPEYCADLGRHRTYPSNPATPGWPAEASPGDVVVVVAYFGARPPAPPAVDAPVIILDATHDPLAPWMADYPADWVFGSLRKTLPVPEGGFAQARSREPLQAPPTESASVSWALDGQEAMAAKVAWLSGASSDRSWYQDLQEHEERTGAVAPSAPTPETVALLRSMPASRWRAQRLANKARLEMALGWAAGDDIRFLPGTFGAVLMAPASLAAAIRDAAVAERIYPARLWPQGESASSADRRVWDEIIQFHTDFRYSDSDMDRTAAVVGEAVAQWRTPRMER